MGFRLYRRIAVAYGSLFALFAVGLQLVVQRLEADLKQVGRARLVVVGLDERLEDQLAFGLVERDRDGQVERVFVEQGALVEHRRRQVLFFDPLAFADDDGVFDHVTQLADVAGPLVAGEYLQHLRGDYVGGALVTVAQLLGHEFGQQRDVFAAFAQRGQFDVYDVQAIEQVFAQFAALHGFERVFVGGRQDAHVHGDLFRAAEPPHLAVFEHAQQLRLQHHRHLGDLVQKERARVGQLETALAFGYRAGEGAALVAEEFRFHQRLGDGRTVDRHEGARDAGAELMNGVRNDLLARARFAGDQNGDRRTGDLLDGSVNLPHHVRGADQPPEDAVFAELSAQAGVF